MYHFYLRKSSDFRSVRRHGRYCHVGHGGPLIILRRASFVAEVDQKLFILTNTFGTAVFFVCFCIRFFAVDRNSPTVIPEKSTRMIWYHREYLLAHVPGMSFENTPSIKANWCLFTAKRKQSVFRNITISICACSAQSHNKRLRPCFLLHSSHPKTALHTHFFALSHCMSCIALSSFCQRMNNVLVFCW